METERLLTRLAALDEEATPAPARLKARIYSSLLARQSQSGPLRSLSACKADGASLCVFEHALAVLPSEPMASFNPCRVCHARLLGERLAWAPIFWPGCPYSQFHNP
jgi:hypothetical protein